MNSFYLSALVVAFILLIVLSNVGKGILHHWGTPVSNAEPAAIARPLVPVGGVQPVTVATPQMVAPAVVAQPVVMPGTGQPVAIMPVPAGSPPPPSGDPSQPLAH